MLIISFKCVSLQMSKFQTQMELILTRQTCTKIIFSTARLGTKEENSREY